MARPRKDNPIITFSSPKGTFYNAEEEREINFIGQRILEGRTRKGLSQDAFRKLLQQRGVTVGNAAISKWEHGDTAPRAYQFLAIWQALDLGEDITFFMSAYTRPKLNDVGVKKVAEYQEDLIASGRYKPVNKEKTIQYREMPVSRLPVSAGTGAFLDEENVEMLPFPVDSIPNGAEFGIRVSGDSMEPVYHDGQIVWVQLCKELSVGEVGIFVYDGEGYIKAYDEREPEEDPAEPFTDSYGDIRKQPVMVSFNQQYPPKIISPNVMFQIIGRVLK